MGAWRWLWAWYWVTIHNIVSRMHREQKPEGYSCYWVALHFASAEDAARYLNETVLPASMEGRLLRGGEILPKCYP